MYKLKMIGAIALIALLFTSVGYAQTHFQAAINFTLAIPQNEFKDNVDQTGLGGSGYFTYKLPEVPLSVGLSLGFIIYGSETREEPFSSTIPDVLVDVTTRNYIFMCHLLFRLQPPEGNLRPYLDGLIGFNYLWTETGIYDQSSLGHSEIASSVHLDDFVISYGAGGGVMIRVYEHEAKMPFSIYIELGARYLKGGKAEYMKEGSISQENGDVIYEISQSTTDLITAHIGVSFAF